MFTPSLKSVNLMTLVIPDLMSHCITPQTGIFSNHYENFKLHTNEFGFQPHTIHELPRHLASYLATV